MIRLRRTCHIWFEEAGWGQGSGQGPGARGLGSRVQRLVGVRLAGTHRVDLVDDAVARADVGDDHLGIVEENTVIVDGDGQDLASRGLDLHPVGQLRGGHLRSNDDLGGAQG
eukprot:gene7097-biopygen12254